MTKKEQQLFDKIKLSLDKRTLDELDLDAQVYKLLPVMYQKQVIAEIYNGMHPNYSVVVARAVKHQADNLASQVHAKKYVELNQLIEDIRHQDSGEDW